MSRYHDFDRDEQLDLRAEYAQELYEDRMRRKGWKECKECGDFCPPETIDSYHVCEHCKE